MTAARSVPWGHIRHGFNRAAACVHRLSFLVAQRSNHMFKLRASELHSFDRDATIRIEIAEQANWGAPADAAAMVGKLGDRDLQFGELCSIRPADHLQGPAVTLELPGEFAQVRERGLCGV